MIVLLIAMLGFSISCKEDEARMYGSPSADYLVKGSIRSTLNEQTIPDIKLQMYPVSDNTDLSDEFLAGSARSDFKGRYVLVVYNYNSWADHSYLVRFTDVYGALNGEYQSLDTTIVFKDVKFTGGDGEWYMGTAEKELNIKLKPKE